jgi:hypothetical protein
MKSFLRRRPGKQGKGLLFAFRKKKCLLIFVG